jgi:hypothetical protein
MPIERQAIMDEGMEAGAPPEEAAPEAPDEATASLPMSLLAGKKVAPGDAVPMEVVSVDEEAGTFTAKYAAEPPAPAEEEPSGVKGMSAEFD